MTGWPEGDVLKYAFRISEPTQTPTPTLTPVVTPTNTPIQTTTPTPTATPTGPHIINYDYTSYCTSIVVNLETNITSYGYVRYNIGTQPSSPDDFQYQAADPLPGTLHQVIVKNLNPGDMVYFQVCATNTESSDCEPNPFETTMTDSDCPDIEAPVLISLPRQVAQSNNSVWLEWIADEQACTRMYYGTDLALLDRAMLWDSEYYAYRLEVIDQELFTDFWHYYMMELWDDEMNFSDMMAPETGILKTTSEPDQTPPQIICQPFCYWVASDRAVVEIYTNEYCSCEYMFGENMDNCDEFGPTVLPRESNHHYLYFDGLLDVQYGYKYMLTDMYGTESPYTDCLELCSPGPGVPESQPPVVVQGPEIHYMSDTTGVIWWQTDRRCAGQAQWWPADNPDDVSTAGHSQFSTDENQWDHFVIITHLQPGTNYQFKIVNGGHQEPESHAFMSDAQPDTDAPLLTGGPQVFPDGDKALIWWTTDEYSDSQVKYGQSTSYGNLVTEAARGNDHTVFLSGLTIGTQYHYQIISRDLHGKQFIDVDRTFTASDSLPDRILSLFRKRGLIVRIPEHRMGNEYSLPGQGILWDKRRS